MCFHDRSVAVIGAAGGIGSALCRSLAVEGARLTLIGRDRQRLETLAAETGGVAVVCDAAVMEDLDSVLAAVEDLYGIVNCAGSLLLKPAHATTPAEFDQCISANLRTAFATVRAGVKAVGSREGSIVLVSSAAARTGLSNHDAIAAAKAGVIGLALSAAATYAPRRIRVNCVAPGLTDTPLTTRIMSNDASRQASASMHALGRTGCPEEVASAIQWFLDPAQAWVTGQVLGVDGGLASVRPR